MDQPPQLPQARHRTLRRPLLVFCSIAALHVFALWMVSHVWYVSASVPLHRSHYLHLWQGLGRFGVMLDAANPPVWSPPQLIVRDAQERAWLFEEASAFRWEWFQLTTPTVGNWSGLDVRLPHWPFVLALGAWPTWCLIRMRIVRRWGEKLIAALGTPSYLLAVPILRRFARPGNAQSTG